MSSIDSYFSKIVSLAVCTILLSVIAPEAEAQPEVELSYLGQFGSSGSGAGNFRFPIDVDTDSQGRIWVLDDLTEKIQICDYSGNCEFYTNTSGTVATYYLPSALAIDDQDRVLILERGNNRLLICNNQNASDCQSIGGFGSALGQFNSPYGVGLNNEGKIIVADTDNRRVQQCDYSGNCTAFGVFAGAQGSPGVWWSPVSVAGNSQGAIFVGEVGSPPGGPEGTGWVHVCNTQGQCSYRWGGRGSGIHNITAPNAFEGDDRGNIFITDTGNHRIKVCTYAGDCKIFGNAGTGEMQFDWPKGIALDEQDRLIVADTDNSRIQIFQVSYPGEEPAFAINAGLNDSWYDPATPGQGFFITVFEDIQMMFLAWFTYDAKRPPQNVEAIIGDPGHRWLTAFGPYNAGVANLDIDLASGGMFDSAVPEPSHENEGTISLEFFGCNEATVTYDLFSAGLAGEIEIERVALDNMAFCEESVAAAH